MDGSSTVSRTANATAVAAAFAKDEARTKALQAKGSKKALPAPEAENEGEQKKAAGRKGPAKKRSKGEEDKGRGDVDAVEA